MIRALILAVASTGLAAAALATSPSVVKAECIYIPPIPPVTKAARSAGEIIVGTVLKNVDGQRADFRLRIDRVLRGTANVGDIRRVKFLYPNWPLYTFADGHVLAPCEPIYAAPGNVIAIAYDALAPDGRTRYTAVTWISGKPQFRRRHETATLEQIVAAAALPQTDGAPRSGPDGTGGRRGFGPLLGLTFVIAIAGGLAFATRRSPSRERP